MKKYILYFKLDDDSEFTPATQPTDDLAALQRCADKISRETGMETKIESL